MEKTTTKIAHMVRHKLTGLYFKPGNYGNLRETSGKIYRTNNDVISAMGLSDTVVFPVSVSSKMFHECVLPLLENQQCVDSKYDTETYVIDGQKILVQRKYQWAQFLARKCDFERVPVKMIITTEVEL